MGKEIDRLIDIVARLRSPEGCPWDREQTHQSLVSCLLDEAYEFIEVAEKNDMPKMREELGDIMLQVALHAQMASEKGEFTIEDVAKEINEKLIRRHPHVFGALEVSSSEEVTHNWEKLKKEEKKRESVLDDIPLAMPALFRAEKVQRRAARVGFDWPAIGPVLDKVEEEFREFREAIESGGDSHAGEELGDILFALVNVARHHGISAEDALRNATGKFIRRFRYVEKKFAEQGNDMSKASLEQMDVYWEESKKALG